MSIYLKLNELQQQINNISTRGLTTAGTANISSLNATYISSSSDLSSSLIYANSLTASALLVSQGDLQIGTDGKGIDFSIVSNSTDSSGVVIDSEILKDYKEGTWIPQISGSSAVGTATYSSQVGRFTKIGRMVYLQAHITWTGHTGTNNLLIGNLPFTTINSSAQSTAFAQYTNLTVPASSVVFLQCASNSTTINALSIATAGASSAALAIDSAATISFSIAYETT